MGVFHLSRQQQWRRCKTRTPPFPPPPTLSPGATTPGNPAAWQDSAPHPAVSTINLWTMLCRRAMKTAAAQHSARARRRKSHAAATATTDTGAGAGAAVTRRGWGQGQWSHRVGGALRCRPSTTPSLQCGNSGGGGGVGVSSETTDNKHTTIKTDKGWHLMRGSQCHASTNSPQKTQSANQIGGRGWQDSI
jgi:hypothetical protein